MEEKIICQNRQASHEYYILDRIEAGIVLDGGEVKSVRLNNVNLKDSFCFITNAELFVKNMHIATYEKAGAFNTKNSKRDRKLLVHKSELVKIGSKISQKGLTLVPLKLYFKGALIKMELGLCQGKHTFDKKKATMEKDIKRQTEREIKNYR
ncbi:MAG: SsrA-binding protein SmpB [Clostridia bacterium]|nr:SsrA-binding protein SmpB [Clostridia bacterium]